MRGSEEEFGGGGEGVGVGRCWGGWVSKGVEGDRRMWRKERAGVGLTGYGWRLRDAEEGLGGGEREWGWDGVVWRGVDKRVEGDRKMWREEGAGVVLIGYGG